jgi:DDE superfamily endonuclease
MDKALMLEWIQKIWQSMTQRSNKVTYLILYQCRLHLTAAVRTAFVDCNTEVDLIPAGYISKLQPVNVGLNKPFKGYESDNLTGWMIVNRNKKPTRQDVATWIHTGWNRLSEQIVLNAYRGSGYIKESVFGSFSSDGGSSVDLLCLMEPSDVDRSDILDEEDEEYQVFNK